MHSAMPYSRPQLWNAVEDTIQEKNRSYFANAFTRQMIFYAKKYFKKCRKRRTCDFI